MSIALLLEMAVSGDPDRVAVIDRDVRLTTTELARLAGGGAQVIAGSGVQHVAYVGLGGAMLPLLIFASTHATVPFTPLNYRLSAEGLHQLIERLPSPLVIADDEYVDAVAGTGKQVMRSSEFVEAARAAEPLEGFADPDSVGIVLFTSGTTSRPKAVELTHNNLTSYVTGTVEFADADAEDAALVCVPPYHIAGLTNLLSGLYSGRRVVYMAAFDPEADPDDPSRPAFRLPAQRADADNFIAEWTLRAHRQPCETDDDCPDGEICRDGFCIPEGPE